LSKEGNWKVKELYGLGFWKNQQRIHGNIKNQEEINLFKRTKNHRVFFCW
jgi:hypothetical protein